MRDFDIRKKLHERLRKNHPQADNRIVDELGLCLGAARIDVALINGKLHGFEIKSERDTLKRLPEQAAVYNKIFDCITLVSSPKHIDKIHGIVPAWWGLTEAHSAKRSALVTLKSVRKPSQNGNVESQSVVQLLWRDEVLDELTKLGAEKGVLNKPKAYLWERLVEVTTPKALSEIVRTRLKIRDGWRADQ